MTPAGPAVAFHDARERAWAAASARAAVEVALANALGHTLARDELTRIDVPHYTSSAMDGWAVCGDGPWRLVRAPALAPGQGCDIVTGGLVPVGATGIVRSEAGSVEAGMLSSGDDPHGRHLRHAGEEAKAGERMLAAGLVLTPAHLAVAAAGGLDTLEIVAPAAVALLRTGDEVVAHGIPRAGFVRDSFTLLLPPVVRACGGSLVANEQIPDGVRGLTAALGDRLDAGADLVIITGGTAGSPADHTRDALERVGGSLVIDTVAMRPGAPTMLAAVGHSLVLALPGNPLAALVGMLTLGVPALAGFAGVPLPALGREVSVAGFDGLDGRTVVVPFRRETGGGVATGHAGSGMLRGLASADGFFAVPAAGVRAGGVADVLPLPW